MILIRLGELTLKSKTTRVRFLRILLQNLKDALEKNSIKGFKIHEDWGRIYVETGKDEEKALSVLSRIFGIHSVSRVQRIEFRDIKDLTEKAKEFYKAKVKNKRFAVRVKRVGEHPFKSIDVEALLGGKLAEFGKVDLNEPEVTVFIEIRHKNAFLIEETLKGPGGLPLGTEGRVLLLFSGGFDSTVSAYLLMKRGVKVDFLFYNLAGILQLSQVVENLLEFCKNWCYGYDPIFVEVDFREIVQEIVSKVKEKYRNLILKRQMYRVANMIAKENKYPAIATGENIGQVSTQTLDHLVVIERISELPVLRPVLALNKDEIIEIAREIGTYQLNAKIKEYCQITPKHPVTHATESKVLNQEKSLNMELLKEVSKGRVVKKVKDLAPFNLEEIEMEEIEDGFKIIDVRPEEEFKKWHIENAESMPLLELKRRLKFLDPDLKYLFVCNRGYDSAEAAYLLRLMGYEAYSLKGGLEKLKKKGASS